MIIEARFLSLPTKLAVIITIIPSVVVYILLHKQIMEGMVAGAVKG